jgi:hypothetical protein
MLLRLEGSHRRIRSQTYSRAIRRGRSRCARKKKPRLNRGPSWSRPQPHTGGECVRYRRASNAYPDSSRFAPQKKKAPTSLQIEAEVYAFGRLGDDHHRPLMLDANPSELGLTLRDVTASTKKLMFRQQRRRPAKPTPCAFGKRATAGAIK